METYIEVKLQPTFSLLTETFQSHLVSGDLGGLTLLPGMYKATEAVRIQQGDLTLDAKGNESAIWIFEFASDFYTVGGAGGNIILTGNAKAENVFWQTEHLARIGADTSFKGNVLAKMMQQDNDGVAVQLLSATSRASEKPTMGWPHYGQRL
jgi:hypothetical protein